MNKKAQGLTGVIIAAIIGVIMLSIIWGIQTAATEYAEQTDTWTVTAIPVNFTLSQDIGIALVSVVNSTGDALDASNYTAAITDEYVTMLDNESFGGTTVDITYTYQQVGYVTSPIARLVVGFVAALLAVGLIVFVVKGKSD